MFRLILNALRARRTQTVAIFLLTLLAVLGGSAAPWFLAWGQEAVAASDIASAPLEQRVVVVRGSMQYGSGGPSPVAVIREHGESTLDIPGAEVSIGARIFANALSGTSTEPGRASVGVLLGSRTGVCAQVRIEGACPGAGEVMLDRTTAETLGVRLGDPVRFDAFRLDEPQKLRLSGTFDVVDLHSPYWAGSDLLKAPAGAPATDLAPAAYLTEETILGLPLESIDLDYHVFLPPAAFDGRGAALLATLSSARDTLRALNLEVSEAPKALVRQIRADQALVVNGILVAALELVLLSWFALYLAVRHTSAARRGDIGLLKLRGAARWRIWMLSAQQSAIPMAAGVLVGAGVGYLAAAAIAGDAAALHPRGGAVLLQSASVAVGIGLGALLAAVVAEWRVLQSSVTTLLRRVPARRTGWRGSIVDLAIVAIAIAGVYQGYAELEKDGGTSALSLLAPGLVGLAIALLMARALPWLATKWGDSALRAGRPGAALSALNVARRPGTDRVFAVLAVCVAVAATALFSWSSANDAWSARAGLELGAPRVLAVKAAGSAALLTAVRAVDPAGDFAMAVAVSQGSPQTRTVAVDSSRLARVAILGDAYGLDAPETLAQRLHPTVAAPPPVRDGELTLDVEVPPVPSDDPTKPLALRVWLATADGAWREVTLGPMAAGTRSYTATVTGCGAVGCRLVGFESATNRDRGTMTLRRLSQGDTDVVAPAVFRDVARWRGPISSTLVGPYLQFSGSGLTLTKYGEPGPAGVRTDHRVLAVDAPGPLPVLASPTPAGGGRPGDPRLLTMGVESVPYRVVGQAVLLPRLADQGTLMDLAYASRSTDRPDESVALEVWLTDTAPGDVTQRLAAAGVEVLTDTSVADLERRLAEHGPGVAIRFALFAAAVLLLIGAGALVVSATVERRDRGEELRNLRDQGLPERAMRFAGYAATMLVVAGAIVTGMLAAIVGHQVVSVSLPVFTDTWDLIHTYRGVSTWGLVLSLLAAVAVLVPAGVLASARIIGSVRAGRGSDSGVQL